MQLSPGPRRRPHSGSDSLKVTGRNADWHGATWDVKNALASGGAGTYALEAYVLGVDSETLGYTVNATNANWLGFRCDFVLR